MKHLALVICILMSALTSAQNNLDSLRGVYQRALEKHENEDAAYCATLLGNNLTMASQYDSAVKYYQSAITLSSRPNFIASTLNSIGVAYNYKGYPDSCIRYYRQALRTYDSLHDTIHAVTIEGNLAIVYKNLGWYDEALETSFNALREIEGVHPDRLAASIYSTIGAVYLLTGDVGRSIHYHKLSLHIRKKVKLDRGIGQSLTNIGEAFISLKRYDSALAYLFAAADVKRKNDNRSELASTLNQIGRVYLLMGNIESAEDPLLEALDIKRSVGERVNEGEILNNIASLRMEQRRYRDAQNLLLEAGQLLRDASDLAHLRRNLELEISLQKALKNEGRALRYAEELIAVKDSLLNAEKADILYSMETRYEVQKKEKQILVLERERLSLHESVKSREMSIAILTSVVAMIVGAAVFISRQNRSLRSARDSNQLLLKEVNHRVKNNLQIISTLFRVPYQELEDSDALRVIKSGESRVNAMALIHSQLSDKTSYRTIHLEGFLSALVNYLDQSYGFSNSNGRINISCSPLDLDIDIAIPLSLIVNELLGNAMKHSKATTISLKVVKSVKNIDVEVVDDGIGYNVEEPRRSGSFGLRLITMMVKELRGTHETASSKKGTQTRIKIPV